MRRGGYNALSRLGSPIGPVYGQAANPSIIADPNIPPKPPPVEITLTERLQSLDAPSILLGTVLGYLVARRLR